MTQNREPILAHLTDRQYQACISEAKTTLVLAGAGTGKTSTLMGRVNYLQNIQHQEASRILLLAFTVDAAHEMQQRLAMLNQSSQASHEVVKASTFHSLGLSIIKEVLGSQQHILSASGGLTKAPNLSIVSTDEQWIESWVQQQFDELIANDPVYRQWLIDYFTEHELIRHTLNSPYMRTLNDDYVSTPAELYLANYFYSEGIPYQYRAHYVENIYLDKPYQPYCCDFYLSDAGVYIDCFYSDETLKNKGKETQANKTKSTCLGIHQQYGTRYIALDGNEIDSWDKVKGALAAYLVSSPDVVKPMGVKSPLPLTRSVGCLKALLQQLIELLKFVKIQGIKAEQLPSLESVTVNVGIRSDYIVEHRLLIALLKPILIKYEQYLFEHNAIDFDTMITRACEYVETGAFKVPWQEVMIDEFQDISLPRLRLIQAMRHQNPDLKLFVVGDDWQTIYPFAGSELHFIRDIENYFGETSIISLDKTFRFHQVLSDMSSIFIQQNPRQYRKPLQSKNQQEQVAIVLAGSDTERQYYIEDILPYIARDSQHYLGSERVEVLVLARFNHDLPDEQVVQQWQTLYPQWHFRVSTIHAAKGTEADYVIVLNVNQGEYGLPAERQETLASLKQWLRQSAEETRGAELVEDFRFASERRVFYVALTRARHRIYMLYDKEKPSSFIQELSERHPSSWIQVIENIS